jgi:hypothetical protein
MTSDREAGMIEWLTETSSSWGLTWTKVLLGLGFFVVTFIGSIALVSFLLIRLPANYFSDSFLRDAEKRHPIWQWMAFLGKNLLGVLLIVLGVVLSFPGLPGQGVITILIGLVLVDFPGKRRLVRWLLSHPKVLDSINRLRQRYGKTPLVVDRSGP